MAVAPAVPPWAAAMALTIARPRPEPGRCDGAAAAVEPVEDVRQLVAGDAGAVVADLDDDVAVAPGGGDGGDGAGGGVRGHVAEDVVEGPAQQFLVAGGHQAVRDVGVPGALRVGDPRTGGALADQAGEVDRVVPPFRRLVQAGQPEHVIDQAAHPLGLQR